MKLENNYYVIMKIGTDIDMGLSKIGTGFLKDDPECTELDFVDDIQIADKYNNYKTALEVKHYHQMKYKYNNELNWEIVPVKITYEW